MAGEAEADGVVDGEEDGHVGGVREGDGDRYVDELALAAGQVEGDGATGSLEGGDDMVERLREPPWAAEA